MAFRSENYQNAVKAVQACGLSVDSVKEMEDGTVAIEVSRPADVDHYWHGKVYVIGFERWVKIGFTSGDVAKRMRAIQTSAPERLNVVASFDGSTQDEHNLHRRFAAQRSHGEWFRREGPVAAWIDEGCPL